MPCQTRTRAIAGIPLHELCVNKAAVLGRIGSTTEHCGQNGCVASLQTHEHVCAPCVRRG
jgi:hypothetical protein